MASVEKKTGTSQDWHAPGVMRAVPALGLRRPYNNSY